MVLILKKCAGTKSLKAIDLHKVSNERNFDKILKGASILDSLESLKFHKVNLKNMTEDLLIRIENIMMRPKIREFRIMVENNLEEKWLRGMLERTRGKVWMRCYLSFDNWEVQRENHGLSMKGRKKRVFDPDMFNGFEFLGVGNDEGQEEEEGDYDEDNDEGGNERNN